MNTNLLNELYLKIKKEDKFIKFTFMEIKDNNKIEKYHFLCDKSKLFSREKITFDEDIYNIIKITTDKNNVLIDCTFINTGYNDSNITEIRGKKFYFTLDINTFNEFIDSNETSKIFKQFKDKKEKKLKIHSSDLIEYIKDRKNLKGTEKVKFNKLIKLITFKFKFVDSLYIYNDTKTDIFGVQYEINNYFTTGVFNYTYSYRRPNYWSSHT